MESRLKQKYQEKVVGKLVEAFGYKNSMQAPKLLKIVVNIGIGKDGKDSKSIDAAQKEIISITGQRPVITRAKKSIAGFNVRKGDICGIMVTLRRNRMYEFLDRLITVALPRVRDFNGLPKKSTDGKNSYTIGIREQVIFPEIDYNSIYKVRGMNITITTNAKTPDETRRLLQEMGLPVREE